MRKLFTEFDMTYKKLLIFSIGIGVFSGVLGGLTSDTSFTDMAGGYDFWVVCALFIVCNCNGPLDAGIKCGLFFLISQPLQFYIQAFLYSHNYGNAWYYTKVWLPVIALTFIGGAIAYYAKKDNTVGAIILGLGNSIQMISFVSYLLALLSKFPRHLLSTLFSIGSVIV